MSWLRPRDYVVLSINLIGTTAATALSILQFQQTNVVLWVLGVLAVLGVTGGTAYAIISANQATARAEQERQHELQVTSQKRRELAESAIEAACRIFVNTLSTAPNETGVIIFLPDEDGVLRTTYALNKDGKPDVALRFEKWQGATGHAWGTGNLVVARLDDVSDEDLRTTWKLSPSYVELTRHLKTVVAAPIRVQNNTGQLLGVISVDSTLRHDACGFADEEGQDALLQVAALLARIMTLAEIG